ncbi:amino acid/amide ABC transporter substrate-binding protein (HAAT family) [Azonexus fungiphilus]|uniref:Amino acid/amide ABC transporter substrate-binding protein (HAAT family) n=1 Tax=Azonexus fungiphilus TaxID=146940 RepID=A0A495WDJ6_9RHOO|nr:ABC transporter substrate-binding protein [Azonexus fungiphilus]RKT58883.1 amino acid/amide ABC transporter substrate-binding protein (HAAT family) [Azonexus fungiphilus]
MAAHSRIARLAAALFAFAALTPAFAAKELLVVQIAPLSGPQGVTGRAIGAGARLYFDHVNAGGGVNGTPIRFVSRDDGQNPETTVRLVRESLEREAPVAFVGSVGTNNVEALVRDGALARSGTPLVGAVSGASSVTGKPSIFIVKAGYRAEIARLFQQLGQVGQKRVGLVYQKDALGDDVLAGADAEAGKWGIELVARAGYERNSTKVEGAVEAMLKANPASIFLGATTLAAVEFVRQYRERGGFATIYGLSIIDSQVLLDKLGPEVARGFAFSQVVPPESRSVLPLVREYARLKAQGKQADLGARSMEGFIAAKALVAALRKGASSGPEAGKAMAATRKLDLGGYSLDFSASDRTGSNYVDFAMLGRGGQVVQ